MLDTPRSLLQRLADTPSDADWRRFVVLYQPFIAYWLRRAGVTPHDADDLSQDVLSVLVKEMPTFRHSQATGAFRKWLRTVVVHRILGFFRTKQTRCQREIDGSAILEALEDPSSDISREWDREHDTYLTRQLIAALEGEFSPTTWLAFRRQMVDGLKPAEVAVELGLTTNAVLIAKSRVLRRFREEAIGLLDD